MMIMINHQMMKTQRIMMSLECNDTDGDTCDDCVVTGTDTQSDDGPDNDSDGDL